MRIFLASLLEPQNFGPGRKIAVFHKNSDKDLGIDFFCEELTPWDFDIDSYNKHRPKYPNGALSDFIDAYRWKLSEFVDDVNIEAAKLNKEIIDVLPLQDGDTLISWEREGNNNYRGILANYLIDLGYEVVLH